MTGYNFIAYISYCVYTKGGIYMEGHVICTLKECLEMKGVTRYRLAKTIDAHPTTIDAYYKNKNFRYDAYFLAKVCYALKCDISHLIKYIPPAEEN